MFDLNAVLQGGGFDGCGSVVAAALKKQQEQAQARLADLLVTTLHDADETIQWNVVNLREVRKQEKLALKTLQDIGNAVEYLKQTGNPLPFFMARAGGCFATACSYARQFCGKLGVPVPDKDDPLWKIQTETL